MLEELVLRNLLFHIDCQSTFWLITLNYFDKLCCVSRDIEKAIFKQRTL